MWRDQNDDIVRTKWNSVCMIAVHFPVEIKGFLPFSCCFSGGGMRVPLSCPFLIPRLFPEICEKTEN